LKIAFVKKKFGTTNLKLEYYPGGKQVENCFLLFVFFLGTTPFHWAVTNSSIHWGEVEYLRLRFVHQMLNNSAGCGVFSIQLFSLGCHGPFRDRIFL
jgi:hypothetical protein